MDADLFLCSNQPLILRADTSLQCSKTSSMESSNRPYLVECWKALQIT